MPLEGHSKFFMEHGARGRVRWPQMHERDRAVRHLLETCFDRHVARHYGGVYWGTEQKTKALVHHDDSLMYFNARAARTLADLFTDICHEYTHIKTENWEHDEHFYYAVENEIARRLARKNILHWS